VSDSSRYLSTRWVSRHHGGAMLLAALMFIFIAGLVTACGADDSEPDATIARGGSETTTAAAESSSLTPEELGTQIGTVYMDAVREVTTLLEAKPEVSSVKAQVETLKEDCATRLVALGKLREALSTSDRATADAKELAVMEAAGKEAWYATYNTVWQGYSTVDPDFSNLVASFNILGQYANFDLLRQQLPEEAARLGVQ
jgi:hypothetical protein